MSFSPLTSHGAAPVPGAGHPPQRRLVVRDDDGRGLPVPARGSHGSLRARQGPGRRGQGLRHRGRQPQRALRRGARAGLEHARVGHGGLPGAAAPLRARRLRPRLPPGPHLRLRRRQPGGQHERRAGPGHGGGLLVHADPVGLRRRSLPEDPPHHRRRRRQAHRLQRRPRRGRPGRGPPGALLRREHRGLVGADGARRLAQAPPRPRHGGSGRQGVSTRRHGRLHLLRRPARAGPGAQRLGQRQAQADVPVRARRSRHGGLWLRRLRLRRHEPRRGTGRPAQAGHQ